MKNKFPAICAIVLPFLSYAQVTQINNNKSLHSIDPLPSGLVVYHSDIDSSIWVTDGIAGNTVQISTVKYTGIATLFNSKIYFTGSTPSNGNELYVTDGTPGGTTLVQDINPGAAGSDPGDMLAFNGNLYFSAVTAANGRELWKSDGSPGGTAILKDIVAGSGSSNGALDSFHLFTNGTFLLFAAESSGQGIELWKSDGTSPGTTLVKDINSGADSSSPHHFLLVNGTIVFFAKDLTHGEELWTTDGSSGGTVLVKDINPGPAGSTVQTFFTLSFPLFMGFHLFNNKAYFNATDGTSNAEVWTTDGTPGNTTMLVDVGNSSGFSGPTVIDAVNYPSKFFFPYGDGSSRSELWQSDGTPGGTSLFMSFNFTSPGTIPAIYVPYGVNISTGTYSQLLFQGNKFFFTGSSSTDGEELWISDGTSGNTVMVKDINPGTADGIGTNQTYLYTSNALYFAATDATHGNELWVSDGTSGGTSLVKDIYPNAGDANPNMDPSFVVAGKIYFTATEGDDPLHTDLFVVNGTFNALPVRLSSFTVVPRNNDALLQWTSQQESNARNYVVERSYDGQRFEPIGSVNAVGNSSSATRYSFSDVGIMTSGRPMVYYRLVEYDKDGKPAFSEVIALRISGNAHWNVRLLSNPVRDHIDLFLSDISGNIRISVQDISGRTVYSSRFEHINGRISLPVSLPQGMYILESVHNNERQTIKFIK